MSVSPREIMDALTQLIRVNLVKAYKLFPTKQPPEEVSGVPAPQEIDKYYFLPTEEGAALQLTDYPDWPFDSAGAVRQDWTPPD